MNKIERLFKEKKEGLFSVYFTAGFPNLEDTNTVISELVSNGVDMLEIGMPFSDPLADGPTIQGSSEVALENGMTVKLLFEQLSKADLKNSKSAMVLMGYLNPVMQYGIEKFCKDASELGIDGVIIPDLPMQEYQDEHKATFDKYNLKNVFLITPQTSEDRILLINSLSDSFIYIVSSASTTGAKTGIDDGQEAYFKRIQSMDLKNPTVIGFGISDKQSFTKACAYANGAIIGSAFIKAVKGSSDLKSDIQRFAKSILG